MSNAAAPAALLFVVVRPCDDGTCPEGTFVCSCHGASGVRVDVDELSLDEQRHFTARGTPAQKALIAEYFGPVTLAPLARAELAHLDAAA